MFQVTLQPTKVLVVLALAVVTVNVARSALVRLTTAMAASSRPGPIPVTP